MNRRSFAQLLALPAAAGALGYRPKHLPKPELPPAAPDLARNPKQMLAASEHGPNMPPAAV